MRVVHQRNGGAYSARNTGLLEAKGDYLTFVDGDDWIEPQMYETLLAAMMEQDADLAVCRYRKIYENRRVDLSTPMAMSGDCSSMAVRTAQVSQSKPYFARS